MFMRNPESIKSFFRKKKVKEIIHALIILLLFSIFTLAQFYIIKLFFPVVGIIFKSNFDEFTFGQIPHQ